MFIFLPAEAFYRLDPQAKYPPNNLANSYFKLNQVNKACEYWRKALDLGYVYKPEWKQEFGIHDPVELVKKWCK